MKNILVTNWRTGWRWFSNWAFVLIVFIATVPIPPEILNLLPSEKREYLMAMVAMAGLILRFINQTKPEPVKPKRTRKSPTTAKRTRKPRRKTQEQT